MYLPNWCKGIPRFVNPTFDIRFTRGSSAKRDLSRLSDTPPNRQMPASPVKSPQQPPKRQGNKKLGQLRKLCLLGGVLPRPIEIPSQREYLRPIFVVGFFDPLYFRGKPKIGVLGRFAGALRPRPTSCPHLPATQIWGALRPNDVPQLQFAASAVLALEPCFDRMTAFLLGQPPHRRPVPAFGAKCQRFIRCRDAVHFRWWRHGCRTCVLRHGLTAFGLNHSGIFSYMPSFRIRLDDIPLLLI